MSAPCLKNTCKGDENMIPDAIEGIVFIAIGTIVPIGFILLCIFGSN